MLTGLWVAISPWFLVLQHGGTNATAANLIAGLAVAARGPRPGQPARIRGPAVRQPLLGAWLIVTPFILDAKFAIASPMYWSNIWSGAILMVLALAGLSMLRRPAR